MAAATMGSPSEVPSLRSCCDNADQYPKNLAPRLGTRLVLGEQAEKLREEEGRIFRADKVNVYMTELLSGTHANCDQTQKGSKEVSECLVFRKRPQTRGSPHHQPYHGPCAQDLAFGNFHDLKNHLQYPLFNGLTDATIRHIFIQAGSNRSPLMCSASMFKYICTYHEISPDFLKLVHSLGDQESPKQSSHFGGFFEELHMEELERDHRASSPASPTYNSSGCSSPLAMPGFNRSSQQLRTFYQLNGMELGEPDEDDVREWTQRQMTVYHSFDLENTRQFWMTIKANSKMRQRFEEQRTSEALGHPSHSHSMQNLSEAFKSSLSSHLLHLEYAVEGWRWHIDQREVKIRDMVEKVEETPVTFNQTTNTLRQHSMYEKSQPDLGVSHFGRFDSWISRASRRSTIDNKANINASNKRVNSWLFSFSRGNTMEDNQKQTEESQDHPLKHQAAVAQLQAKDLVQRFIDTEGIFKDFSIDGFQDLTECCTALQDTKLSIDSNIRVLDGIRQTYTSFIDSDECPQDIQSSCKRQVRQFARRIDSLKMELSREYQRAESLICQIQDAKPLYESILQYRNLKANEAMASHSRYAAIRMEAVGERTERLTSSMHVITTFTLLLLPGTFLGSLFSTDIISREPGASGVKLDLVLGALFLKICLPMMIISLMVWIAYMLHKRRRVESRKVDLVRLEEGILEEEKEKALGQTG